MFLDFYFYVFYRYFLKKKRVGDWSRACGIVCISLVGIANIMFILLRQFQIINVFNHLPILRIILPVILFTIVYFLFGYKKREEIIFHKFHNKPIDSRLNRSLCWIAFLLCLLIPMILAVYCRNGSISSIPWSSHH